MELNSNAVYLSLALDALETVVAPELQSPPAKDAASTIKHCLEHLLARAQCDGAALRQRLRVGEELWDRLSQLARGMGIEVERTDGISNSIDGFDQFAAAYAALTAQMATLLRTLSESRGAEPLRKDVAEVFRAIAQWEADIHTTLTAAPTRTAAPQRSTLSREPLEAFIQSVHPDGAQARITAFERVPGGFGKQTYLLTLRAADGSERALIVRKSDPVPPLLHRSSRLDREFDYVQAIAATGYPAPRPLWFGSNVPGIDADFYIMERLPGRMPASYLGGANVPEGVALDMAECLARLHAMGPRDFPDIVSKWEDDALLKPDDTVEACNRRIIASWRQYASDVPHPPSPLVEYLLDWLESHIPHDRRPPSLIHGDYNVHNVLADDGRITGILDWEVVGFGAPEQDIAFLKPNISQHIEWERFYQRYRACGGRACDADSLNFYQTFSALRILLAGGRMTRNLKLGTIFDIRHTIFELGLNPQFMRMALQSTSAT